MLPLRRGRIALRCLSSVQGTCRYYNPYTHKEPPELCWQWSVKTKPDLMRCKDININKACPKPSFFPRFRKVFIPADHKACEKKKISMSWKEYWSFLLPDKVKKPPLLRCRKLQAQRRKCCISSTQCTDDSAKNNCCPPPKEWHGQAEIYVIPSCLPPIQPCKTDPQPCVPQATTGVTCVVAVKEALSTPPKKTLNLDDYAYKKAFSGISLCDEMKETTSTFKFKGVCVEQLPEGSKNLRLSCGYLSQFKEVKCSEVTPTKGTVSDMPALVCNDKSKKMHQSKEINVEVKKGVCGRTTLLKPYKYGDDGAGEKKFHTDAYKKQETSRLQTRKQLFHSTSQAQMKNSETNEGGRQQTESFKTEPKFEEMEITHKLHSDYTCQPSKSGVGLNYMLLKPLSGRLRDGLHAPPPACRPEDLYYNQHSQEIDPELSKLAETTRKNLIYRLPPKEKEETTTTLAKELSKLADQKNTKKIKEKGLGRKPVSPVKAPNQQSKLSLLKKKKNSTLLTSQATFMTQATINVKRAKKKDKKNKNDKNNTICAGCPGIKAAAEEEKNPTPKSFLDCKVRPAGRCRGPQRKVFPDEGEPQNPYFKSKQKPYSMCNKPRPLIKKKERPYKMPCEENTTKRGFHLLSTIPAGRINKSGINKFHSTTCLNDSNTHITTIYDLIKVRGLNKIGKQAPNHANDWDSHTSDSYGERTGEEYDSLPDLSKYQSTNDENGIKKMSYPVNLWEYPDNKNKQSYNSWPNNEGNNFLMGANRHENINNNNTYLKRKPILNMNKDLNNNVHNAPSKYNMLFNSTSQRNQTENINRNTNQFTNKPSNHEIKFKNIAEFKEKSTSNLKTSDFNFNTDNKAAFNTAAKEITTCPITTQNMWKNSHGSPYEQNSQLFSQEMKVWEKQKSHNLLRETLANDCNTHNIFRLTEESKKVSTKPDNDNLSTMFCQEKIMLSGSANLENLSNINDNKQD